MNLRIPMSDWKVTPEMVAAAQRRPHPDAPPKVRSAKSCVLDLPPRPLHFDRRFSFAREHIMRWGPNGESMPLLAWCVSVRFSDGEWDIVRTSCAGGHRATRDGAARILRRTRNLAKRLAAAARPRGKDCRP